MRHIKYDVLYSVFVYIICWDTVEKFYCFLLYFSFLYDKHFTQNDQILGFNKTECYKLHTNNTFESNSTIYWSKTGPRKVSGSVEFNTKILTNKTPSDTN